MIDGSARLQGLDFGTGTPYRLATWPAGLGTPPIRTDDRARPRRHGVTPGDDLLGAREVAFEFIVQGHSLVELETRLTALSAAFAPVVDNVWLDLRMSGFPAEYQLLGRPRGCEWDLGRGPTFGEARARGTFVATDPRKFGALQHSPASLIAPTSALVLPEVLPWTTTAPHLSQTFDATNAGTLEADWSATIEGPCVNPVLEHLGLGAAIRMSGILAAGESITLDSSTATVSSGTAFLPDWLSPTSRWFTLGAGVNPLRFSADTASGSVDLTFRPAWA